MNPLQSIQHSRNREAIDAWNLYEPHRRRVTSLIREALPDDELDSARVCLLGAGNCNDVDLNSLVEQRANVLLIDLDADSLQQGIARQNLTDRSEVQFQTDLDLTGLFDQLQPRSSSSQAYSAQDVRELAAQAETYSVNELPGGFDVVASMCLLSQLIDGILHCIPDPQMALPLLQAVRQRHLRLLLEQCRPGGRAVLFSEIVSSDTCPELTMTPDHQLQPLLTRALSNGNFFTGLHPGIIQQELHSCPSINSLVADVKTVSPWRWPFLTRTYAVTAFVVQRAEAG